MINIALDFVGNATSILEYAGKVENKGRNEDDLAYMRDEREYRNLLITEQPNGDYANTIARQFLFDTYMFFLYEELKNSKDETIAAIAVKGEKITFPFSSEITALDKLYKILETTYAWYYFLPE